MKLRSTKNNKMLPLHFTRFLYRLCSSIDFAIVWTHWHTLFFFFSRIVQFVCTTCMYVKYGNISYEMFTFSSTEHQFWLSERHWCRWIYWQSLKTSGNQRLSVFYIYNFFFVGFVPFFSVNAQKAHRVQCIAQKKNPLKPHSFYALR